MGTPNPPSLGSLTGDVKRALANLYANLRKSVYRDNAVKLLHASVIDLHDRIQAELSNNPYHPNKGAVRNALKSLRSVEGSIRLLISCSSEYATSDNPAAKREIQETWMNHRNKLLDQAESCAEGLDVVLAFADDLDSPGLMGEPGRGSKSGSNLPDDGTTRKRGGRAS